MAILLPQITLDKLTRQLVRDEGLKQVMYTDSVGVPTIGIGHNLTRPISIAACNKILEDDIADVLAELDREIPWWRSLDEVRQMVLINMGFNLGVPRLMKFKNTIEAVKHQRYEEAAVAMLQSNWAEQVGDRALRLAEMMRSGKEY